MPISDQKDEKDFVIQSLVSQRTGEGVVEMQWGDKKAQFTADEAREQGHSFLECAEAAETDAFMVEFFESIGGNRENAIKMLLAFRTFREKRNKKH